MAFQVMRMLGVAGVADQLLRSTRKIATQLFAALGVCVIVTVTPVCGLSTVNATLEIEVVPAGIREDRSTDVVTLAVPPQTASSDPRAQVDAALGNSGAFAAAIAVVTVMPLMVVGALV